MFAFPISHFSAAGGGAAPWNNISTASYDSVSFSTNTQTGSAQDIFIKPDGTKFYVLGVTTDRIHQYSMSTAWDLSTASYDSKYIGVNSEETTPNAIFMKEDGTKLYVAGQTSDTVFQYTLSTAWDISTASYDSKSMSVSSEDGITNGLFFEEGGATCYTVGMLTDEVYQYTLSTPWDISTGSYASKSFDISSECNTSESLFFHPNGDKVYVIASDNDTIFQYTLSTPWDASTGTYDSNSFSVTSQDSTPQGFFFKEDGSKFYMCGSAGVVYQYSL